MFAIQDFEQHMSLSRLSTTEEDFQLSPKKYFYICFDESKV